MTDSENLEKIRFNTDMTAMMLAVYIIIILVIIWGIFNMKFTVKRTYR
jgi:hypothetical protein